MVGGCTDSSSTVATVFGKEVGRWVCREKDSSAKGCRKGSETWRPRVGCVVVGVRGGFERSLLPGNGSDALGSDHRDTACIGNRRERLTEDKLAQQFLALIPNLTGGIDRRPCKTVSDR